MKTLQLEFAVNPLTLAHPEFFAARGDGLALTNWWLTRRDEYACFSLFAIRGEGKWTIDAVRNDVHDVDDDEAYIGIAVFALEEEGQFSDWVADFAKRMSAVVPFNADISWSTYAATHARVGNQPDSQRVARN